MLDYEIEEKNLQYNFISFRLNNFASSSRCIERNNHFEIKVDTKSIILSHPDLC